MGSRESEQPSHGDVGSEGGATSIRCRQEGSPAQSPSLSSRINLSVKPVLEGVAGSSQSCSRKPFRGDDL